MTRDLRIDTLRGLLLIIMTLNHTHNALLYQGWIQRLTVAPLGYVTGAEGFIFISGFVMGLVYAKFSAQPRQLTKKCLARSQTIYLHHLIPLYSLHLAAFAVPFLAFSWKKNLSFYYLGKRTLLAEALLLYQPEIFDILPIYVIFVLATPLLLLTLKKKWGFAIVIALSLLLWCLGQRVDPLCALNESLFPGHRCGWFNILVWQLIYGLGLILGFYQTRLGKVQFFKNRGYVLVILAATIGLFCLRHGLIDLSFGLGTGIEQKNVGWLRVVNLVLLAAFFSLIFLKLPRQAHIPGVDFLGQHSLQVFTFHVLLIYLITPFREAIVSHLSGWTYPLFMLLVVLSLLIPAYLHQRWRAGGGFVRKQTR